MSIQRDARSGLPLVIALHCSGGTSRQWRKLGERLEDRAVFLAPDLLGTAARPRWHGRAAFSLAAEAEPILAVIDGHQGPVHLVGHSYGGGLALHIAANRPDRLTTLSLYEPSAFHLLKVFGSDGRLALQEILSVAAEIQSGLSKGEYARAAARFVDYWNGPGTFDAFRPEQQDEIISYLWKGALDFHALIDEQTPLSAYRGFEFPLLILRGEHAPWPTRLIAERLAGQVEGSALEIIEGAGHMGPLTHGDLVASLLAQATGIVQLQVARAA